MFKKRIALPGRGKSGGARTILFYQTERKLIFCFGYSKNQQEDLNFAEFKYVNFLSDAFQKIMDPDIQANGLIEIREEGYEKLN